MIQVGWNEPSFSKDQASPYNDQRSKRMNPEETENITPEKSRNSITRGNTSQASPYAKLGYFEGINQIREEREIQNVNQSFTARQQSKIASHVLSSSREQQAYNLLNDYNAR